MALFFSNMALTIIAFVFAARLPGSIYDKFFLVGDILPAHFPCRINLDLVSLRKLDNKERRKGDANYTTNVVEEDSKRYEQQRDDQEFTMININNFYLNPDQQFEINVYIYVSDFFLKRNKKHIWTLCYIE